MSEHNEQVLAALARLDKCIDMEGPILGDDVVTLMSLYEDVTAQLAEAQAALAESEEERDMNGRGIEEGIRRENYLRAQLERSPCGHLKAEWVPEFIDTLTQDGSEDIDGYCAGCRREADAVRIALGKERDRILGLSWIPLHTRQEVVRGFPSYAPASQPTAEPLLNVSDRNNEWNKRAIEEIQAKRGKEGE